MRFFSMRNEQSASYAASIHGYLSGHLAASLSVAGPGLIHSLAGLSNAWANHLPLLHLSARASSPFTSGGFQESAQIPLVVPFTKFAASLSVAQLPLLPLFVERAVREATYGRKGPSYLDFEGELVRMKVRKSEVRWRARALPPPRAPAAPDVLACALQVWRAASRPLLILGKGAAMARAEQVVRRFHSLSPSPFLPTPMGKGLIPDSSPLNASAARSLALARADVVLVLGARFNWQLHFGASNRFLSTVHIIHVDHSPEELGNSFVAPAVAVCGDVAVVMESLCQLIEKKKETMNPKLLTEREAWVKELQVVCEMNEISMRLLCENERDPITYYRAFDVIRALLPRDAIVINEGANTMDIGRTMLSHQEPRLRLDAGTFATMGLGVGYALAAQACFPLRRVVAIEGDSAFGFSAMDFESFVRYQLPVTFIIFNNSGVYYGSNETELRQSDQSPLETPVTSLSYQSRYHLMPEMFGGPERTRGYLIDKSADLERVLKEALSFTAGPTIINIVIASQQGRKQASHSWMSSTKSSSKL